MTPTHPPNTVALGGGGRISTCEFGWDMNFSLLQMEKSG